MPTKTQLLEQEVSDLKKRLNKFTSLAERYHEKADPEDLCNDGKEFLRELSGLLGKPTKVERVKLEIEIADFELPPGEDPFECGSYLVTVMDKDGKVITEKEHPDNVDDRSGW
jgi:hypothetical protein